MKKNLKVPTAIIFILAVIVIPVSVSAVRLAPPGRVPQTKPLQPIPEAVVPNISENINAQNGIDGLPEATPPEGEGQGQNSDSAAGPDSGQQSAPATPGGSSAQASAGFWLWFFAVLLVVGGAIIFNWKKIRRFYERYGRKR